MKRRLAAAMALLISCSAAMAGHTAEENRRFVGQLFRDLLERPASSAELTALTELAGSSGRAYAVRFVQGSIERYNRVVQELYRTHLRRDPAPGESTQWVNSLRKNGALEPVRTGILGSGELYGRAGGGTTWVQAVYKSLLGRAASLAEAKVPASTFASAASRGQFASKVLGSSEARTSLIQEMYFDLLGRRANPAEVGHWQAMMNKGTGEEAIRTVLLSSDEYFVQAQTYRGR
jgi:hypothetical protein